MIYSVKGNGTDADGHYTPPLLEKVALLFIENLAMFSTRNGKPVFMGLDITACGGDGVYSCPVSTKDINQATGSLALGFGGNPVDTSVISQKIDMITHLISIRLHVARLMSSVAPLRPRCSVKHAWRKDPKGLATHL